MRLRDHPLCNMGRDWEGKPFELVSPNHFDFVTSEMRAPKNDRIVTSHTCVAAALAAFC